MDGNIASDPIATALAITIITSIIGVAFFKSRSKRVPTVRQITIYPIKSCAETHLDSAAVTPRGFRHDRVFQVVAKADQAWRYCTPRNKAFEKLFHVTPTFSEDGRRLELASPHGKGGIFTLEVEGASTSPLVATVMGDSEISLEDYGDGVAAWLGGATGIEGPRLVGIAGDGGFRRCVAVNADQGEALPPSPAPAPVSLADEAPFLLATRESLRALNAGLAAAGKEAVDMRRFRPNIVVEGLRPWEEDSLKRVRIGGVEFHVWQRCGRCTMTTIDRDTLQRGAEPLSALSKHCSRERDHGQRNFGMHLIPVLGAGATAGGGGAVSVVSVGDELEILEYDDDRRKEWVRLFG